MVVWKLEVREFASERDWLWVLRDKNSTIIAEHDAYLEQGDARYTAFEDLPRFLRYRMPAQFEEDRQAEELDRLLADAAEWMRIRVFGEVFDALSEKSREGPVCVVLHAPDKAKALLFRPYELACYQGGSESAIPIRFVYDVAGTSGNRSAPDTLRLLAVFSAPHNTTPLNLRHERCQLRSKLESLSNSKGFSIESHFLQYGVTRKTLYDALCVEGGWDVIHFSGHGQANVIVLEDETGGADYVQTSELLSMLRAARSKADLIVLSSCLSGAADLRVAEYLLGVKGASISNLGLKNGVEQVADFSCSSVAHTFAQELGCAVLGMRFPVGDDFASALVLEVYRQLLEESHPLPTALETALRRVSSRSSAIPGLSYLAPILVGAGAAKLHLTPGQKGRAVAIAPTRTETAFPQEPPRFVGRLVPLLKAGQALALNSSRTCVVFHGMAGAGKTSCALELCYRFKGGRFDQWVWHSCTGVDTGLSIEEEFDRFLFSLETQLELGEEGLLGLEEEQGGEIQLVLARLTKVLLSQPVLVVIDNLESVLTPEGDWQDSRWGILLESLLAPKSMQSRIVITTRRLPIDVFDQESVENLPINTLSFGESLVLTRQLPNLRKLYEKKEGRELLCAVLYLVQGHPKLLELVNSIAVDPEQLRDRLNHSTLNGSANRDAGFQQLAGNLTFTSFFTEGQSDSSEEHFLSVLRKWASDLMSSLPSSSSKLLTMLCCLENDDRDISLVRALWPAFFASFTGAQADKKLDFDNVLQPILKSGLIDICKEQLIVIHPAVVDVVHERSEETDRIATDQAMIVNLRQLGVDDILQFLGSNLRGIPYLVRAQDWELSFALLSAALDWNPTPLVINTASAVLFQIEAVVVDRSLLPQIAHLRAKVLCLKGHYTEAEECISKCLDHAKKESDYLSISGFLGTLVYIRIGQGRFHEALSAAEERQRVCTRAGFGKISMFVNAAMRFRALNALQHHAQVLEEVLGFKQELLALEDSPIDENDESISLWQLQEAILDAGRSAATHLSRWKTSLELNSSIVKIQRKRSAPLATIARAHLNALGPLVELGRANKAFSLAKSCRAILEDCQDVVSLAVLFAAQAIIEKAMRNDEQALAFSKIAIRYAHLTGDLEACAAAHNNLGNYLDRGSHEARCHYLAAAYIGFFTESNIRTSSLNLAQMEQSKTLPKLEEITETVNETDGVDFLKLIGNFTDLEKRSELAHAHITKVVRQSRVKSRKTVSSIPRSLPEAIQIALKRKSDEELEAALLRLVPREALYIWESLNEQGLIQIVGANGEIAPTTQDYIGFRLRKMDQLVQSVATAAHIDSVQNIVRNVIFPELDRLGLDIQRAIESFWNGERDESRLTQNLDTRGSSFIKGVLSSDEETQ